MNSWRSILLDKVHKKQADWIQYLSQFSSMFNATKRAYVDITEQIKEIQKDKKSWESYESYAKFIKTKKLSLEKINTLIIENTADQKLPLFKSEPLNGFGGPLNRPIQYFIAEHKKASYLETLSTQLLSLIHI